MLQSPAEHWVLLSFWACGQWLAFCRGDHATDLGERFLWMFWIPSLCVSASQGSHSHKMLCISYHETQPDFWNIWITVGLLLGKFFFSIFLNRWYAWAIWTWVLYVVLLSVRFALSYFFSVALEICTCPGPCPMHWWCGLMRELAEWRCSLRHNHFLLVI